MVGNGGLGFNARLFSDRGQRHWGMLGRGREVEVEEEEVEVRRGEWRPAHPPTLPTLASLSKVR
jgi:hypothetical protein